jgi:predicted dehydrogenase
MKKKLEIDAGDDHGYYSEFEDFYNAIISGSEVYSTFHEGYKDLEVVLAALASAEKKKLSG